MDTPGSKPSILHHKAAREERCCPTLFFAIALALVPGCTGHDGKTVDPRYAAVQRALEQQLRLYPGATAASVSISQSGQTVFASAAGTVSGRPGAAEAAADTLFPVASMTKSVTALAVLVLVQDGALALDEPVASYIPQWQFTLTPQRAALITVRQLLNHSSCLNDGEEGGRDLADFVERDLPRFGRVVCPPGSLWFYSNWGYSVLGRLIERVSGKAFTEFVRERVLQPLGMNSSTYSLDEASRGNFAEGHELSILLDPVPVESEGEAPYGVPNGGLITSANDYGRVIPALVQNDALIGDDLRAAVKGSSLPTVLSGPGDRWGLGVRFYETYPLGGRLLPLRAAQHDGNTRGASATSTLFLDRDVMVTVMINTFAGGGWAAPVVQAALEATGGLPPGAAPPPSRPVAEYTGTFENADTVGRFSLARIELEVREGQLRVSGTQGDGSRVAGVLKPVFEDHFEAPGEFGSYLTFIRDEAGAIRFATNRFTVLEKTK